MQGQFFCYNNASDDVFNGFAFNILQNISLREQSRTLKAYVKDTINGVFPQEPDEISLNRQKFDVL